MGAEPEVKIDHARIYSRVMKETDGDPMVIRRAKAFCAVVREMPITIDPNDLFVGYIDGIWAGQQVSEGKGELWNWLSIEMGRGHFPSARRMRES